MKVNKNYKKILIKIINYFLFLNFTESKVIAILWYCHNMFPPQLKVSTDENGAKLKKKYSIVSYFNKFKYNYKLI